MRTSPQQKPTLRRRGRVWPLPALLLVLGLLVSHLIGARLEETVASKERTRFEGEAAGWSAFLEAQLGTYVGIVHRLRDWATYRNPIEEEHWSDFFHSLNARQYYPGFVAFGMVDSSFEAVRGWHVEQMRARFGTNYAIHATMEGTVANYSWYYRPLTWLHVNVPRGQPDAFQPDYGQDLNQVPELWDAMNWALGANRPGAGASLRLPGQGTNLSGVPIFVPVFSSTTGNRSRINAPGLENSHITAIVRAGSSLAEAQEYFQNLLALRGLAFGVLDFPTIFQQRPRGLPPDFALRLTIADSQGRRHEAYRSSPREPASAPRYGLAFTNRFAGRDWVLEATAGAAFDSVSSREAYWFAAGAGSALALLAAGFVAYQSHARHEKEAVAEALAEARETLELAMEERRRLGRDLHDKTIQSIYSTRLALGFGREKLLATEPKLAELLGRCEMGLEQCIQELREFIAAREAEPTHAARFPEALAAMVEHLRPVSTAEWKVEVDATTAEQIPNSQAAELLCIAREALSNSIRHAQAQHIELSLRRQGTEAVLRVSDDGRGFDPRAVKPSGMGVANIVSRVGQLGGRLDLRSQPGQGTVLEVWIKLPSSEDTAA